MGLQRCIRFLLIVPSSNYVRVFLLIMSATVVDLLVAQGQEWPAVVTEATIVSSSAGRDRGTIVVAATLS